jgi:Ca2+-binding EF-hand superfamily protein
MIEPSEMTGRGEFVRRMAERSGLDVSQPVSIDKLASSLDQSRRDGGDRSRDGGNRDGGNRDDRNRDDRNRDDRNRDDRNNSSNNSSNTASSKPAAPTGPQGFGVAATATASVPGFDTPLIAGVSTEPIEKRFDAEVIEYVKENMLRERDVNKNGMLERNEWTGRWSTPAEESDLNKDGILSMEELCIRIAKRFGREGSSRGGSSPSGLSSSVPGAPFGDASRFRSYAEGFIRQYDENKNGMLEREESEKMRPEHRSADANKDGVIAVDELAAHLAKYSGGGAGSASFSSRGLSGDKAQLAKRSYRVSSPVERLPKGMPDWFLRNDLDADGQISMAEYATSWNDQIASEFTKLDANGDGIITPSETQSSGR